MLKVAKNGRSKKCNKLYLMGPHYHVFRDSVAIFGDFSFFKGLGFSNLTAMLNPENVSIKNTQYFSGCPRPKVRDQNLRSKEKGWVRVWV